MARSTDRTRSRRDAEDRYPIKVDVPVPTDGRPWPFGEMLAWCRENVTLGWEQHGFMDKKRRDERGIPIDYARFYFVSDADAEAFRKPPNTQQDRPGVWRRASRFRHWQIQTIL
jgi:hypothetical protein